MTTHRNSSPWHAVYHLRKKIENNEFGELSDIYILNIAGFVTFFPFAKFLCHLRENRNEYWLGGQWILDVHYSF